MLESKCMQKKKPTLCPGGQPYVSPLLESLVLGVVGEEGVALPHLHTAEGGAWDMGLYLVSTRGGGVRKAGDEGVGLSCRSRAQRCGSC